MGFLFRVFFFVVPLIVISSYVHAGIYIEPPTWQSPWITLEPTVLDDEHDTDQSFSERHQYIVRVTNEARRFLGVYIDRLYPPHPVIEIDNGPNDHLINPAEPSVSISNLQTWLSYYFGNQEDFTNKSRCYRLPLPDDLKPGETSTYRIKLLGLSAINQLPYDLIGGNAPPQASRLMESSVHSLFHVLLGPLVRHFLSYISPPQGEVGLWGVPWSTTKEERILKGLINDVISHPENAKKWFNMVAQGDWQGVIADYMKFVASSETSLNLIRSGDVQQDVDKFLSWGSDIISNWNIVSDVVDIPYVLACLGASAWEDEYTIRVVAPQITEIIPDEGEAGDIVAVHGKGFDPEEPSNNKVFFSKLNEFDTMIPASLEGEVVSTEDFPITRDCLYVRVPEGFVPGPVEVQVDMLTSNRVSFADNFKTTIKITDPRNGDHLAGEVYTVEARLYDLPENFPDRPAIVRFYVDETLQEDQTVNTGVVTFTLDMSLLSFDAHTLKVEAEFPGGYVISDSITVTRIQDLSEIRYAHIECHLQGHWQNVNSEGETYGDVFSAGAGFHFGRDWEGSFQGSYFTCSVDYDSISPPINRSVRLSAVLSNHTSGYHTLASFDFGYRLELGSETCPSCIDINERQVRGGTLPLTEWDEGGRCFEYEVTGQAVRGCITGIPLYFSQDCDPYKCVRRKLVGIDCNEDSYLRIRFSNTPYSICDD